VTEVWWARWSADLKCEHPVGGPCAPELSGDRRAEQVARRKGRGGTFRWADHLLPKQLKRKPFVMQFT
jgi:hypothetical protein